MGPGVELSEKYAPQPEISTYVNHVADRFDLPAAYRFDTRVNRRDVRWKAPDRHIETDPATGSRTFCIMAVGCRGANSPNSRASMILMARLHHRQWPHQGVTSPACVSASRHRLLGIHRYRLSQRQASAPDGVPAHRDLVGAALERKVLTRNICRWPGHYRPRGPRRAPPDWVLFPLQPQAALEAGLKTAKSITMKPCARRLAPFSGPTGDLLFEKAANDTNREFAAARILKLVEDPATPTCFSRTRLAAAPLLRYRSFETLHFASRKTGRRIPDADRTRTAAWASESWC